MSKQFKQGACQCCDMGAGSCCLTCCCPCIAYYQAAENIGDDNGALYAAGSLIGMSLIPGLGCVMLTILGDKVAKKSGIEDHSIVKSGLCAFCDCCTCYSCTVVAEAQEFKETGAKEGTKEEMAR